MDGLNPMNTAAAPARSRLPLMPPAGYGQGEMEHSLGAIWRTIAKRKVVIALTTLLVFASVAVVTLRAKPVYESKALLQIAPQQSSSLGLEDVIAEKTASEDPDSRLATEVKLIQSDTVVARVIDAEGLARNPAFAGPGAGQGRTAGNLRSMSPAERQALLGMFKGALTIKVVPGTQLVEVHFRSTDPKLAAELANAVAQQYIQRNFQTHYEGAMQVSSWLSQQMAELKAKAVDAQQKLAEFQKANDIVGTDENDNIVVDRLKQLNQQVAEAEADRIVKEARYRLARSGDPELLGSTVATGTLQTLRGQQLELKAQLAELTSKFGEGYPKVREMQSQLARLDEAIATEIGNVGKRLEDEYQASANTEELLRKQFAEAKADAYRLNEHAVQYSVLRHDVETSRQLYDMLQVKLQVAGVTAGLNSGYVTIVDPAEVPSAPVEPKVRSNLALGLFGGLLSGLLLGFLVESFDDTVSTSAELETITALPVLCSIPSSANQGAARAALGATEGAHGALPMLVSQPHSQAAEAFRGLRSAILLSTPQVQPKVIAVVSSIATEGKTTVAANLGVSFAQRGEMVLLVDGDLRRSSLHAQFGVPAAPQGLSTFLTQNSGRAPVIKPLESLPNLDVLPAGPHPPNPAELLGSKRMADVLGLLQADYDRIIIDTPPLLSVSDALPLAHFADAAVLVVRSGVARRKAVLRVRDLLHRANANLVGVVFNCVNLQLENYYGFPGSKYGKAMNSYYRSGDGEAD